MVYVFMALYFEAKPIICRLELKKEKTAFGFDIYATDKLNMKLVITGVGMVAAATAVGSMLTYYYAGSNRDDITLINFGSCAGKGSIGDSYLCNKIIDYISEHTFYPDIVYRHNYSESYVVTEPRILKNGLNGNLYQNSLDSNLYQNGLHDMEASAIYQAGSHFLSPQKMSFIKVISDIGQGETFYTEKLTEIMEIAAEPFLEYLLECIERDMQENEQANRKGQIHEQKFEHYKQELKHYKQELEHNEQKLKHYNQEFEQLCQQLHCSAAMRVTVRQCIKYWTLAEIDYQTIIKQMREQNELPCKDRREGKKKLEELKKKLL